MTKDFCFTLTTGDLVRNIKEDFIAIVAVLSQSRIGTVCVEDISLNLDNWELFRSRLVVTPEQEKNIVNWNKWVKEHTVKH